MKWHHRSALLLLAFGLYAAPVRAEPSKLQVVVEGLDPDGRLPKSSAFCVPPNTDPASHNISPAVKWSPGPAGTKSYALIMTDLDGVKDLSFLKKPDVPIPPDAERASYIHWVLIDIPPKILSLERGAESPYFIPKGLPIGATDHGLRGANVYSDFYPKDSPLHGIRGGFDGPCPPRNDPMKHRYVTRVYALDVEHLGLEGAFFGEEVEAKMKGHILAVGEANAFY
jgi:Raf kinase inhibitor-like YbhB/YbcL family protein